MTCLQTLMASGSWRAEIGLVVGELMDGLARYLYITQIELKVKGRGSKYIFLKAALNKAEREMMEKLTRIIWGGGQIKPCPAKMSGKYLCSHQNNTA